MLWSFGSGVESPEPYFRSRSPKIGSVRNDSLSVRSTRLSQSQPPLILFARVWPHPRHFEYSYSNEPMMASESLRRCGDGKLDTILLCNLLAKVSNTSTWNNLWSLIFLWGTTLPATLVFVLQGRTLYYVFDMLMFVSLDLTLLHSVSFHFVLFNFTSQHLPFLGLYLNLLLFI